MQGVIGYPLGYQHITTTNATGLTLPTAYPSGTGDPSGPFRGVKGALISVSGASVNFRDDGTAPTTATNGGVPLPAGTLLWYDGNFAKIQFISSAGAGLVDVVYYG